MAQGEVLLGLAEQLRRVLAPLVDALTDEQRFSLFLNRYGWAIEAQQLDIDNIRRAFDITEDVAKAVQYLGEISGTVDVPVKALTGLVESLQQVVSKLRSLPIRPAPASLPPEVWPALSETVLDGLIADYLERYHPILFSLLLLAGIADEVWTDNTGSQHGTRYMRPTFTWRRLRSLISSPTAIAKEAYAWDDPEQPFRFGIFLDRIVRCATVLGLPAESVVPSPERLAQYYNATNPYINDVREARVRLFAGADESESGPHIGLFFLPIPPRDEASEAPSGIAIGSEIGTSIATVQSFWPLMLEAYGGFHIDDWVRIEIQPSGVNARLGDPIAATFEALLNVTDPSHRPYVLFGSPYSHRVQASGWHCQLRLTGTVAAPELELAVAVDRLQLIVHTSDLDAFVSKFFGAEPQSVELAAALSWSSANGFRFRGHGGLDARLPLHLETALGIIDAVTLSVRVVSRNVAVISTVSGTITLGPIEASLERLGVQLTLAPLEPDEASGYFGDLGVSVGLKAPDGVAVLIKSSAVTGGGYLFFVHELEQYAGALQLQINNSISVTAFGLLTTQLPDRSKGFSLFVLITAEGFQSIPLGLGFTLTGLGGLIGINRTVNLEMLRAGLHSRTLDSLLFPINPVRNAPQIVSNLNAVFPPAEGRYLFGPIAKLAWGTPTLVTINLALILEFPAPLRLIILAQLKALLPAGAEEENTLVRINMDALGVINFDRGEISLDATLYDSKLVQFTLTGDMALRARWMVEPMFILAVGGFNPRFSVPAGFPRLNRLAISLTSDPNLRLRLEAYFALTSNTVQLGARLDLFVKISEFTLEGFLGFDALFHFDPFAFVADMGGALALKRGSDKLMAVTVALTLSGPSPWHAQGKATFELLFIKITAHFEVTFGERQIPPPTEAIDVRAMLVKALQDPRSWSAKLPEGAHALVTFRRVSSTAGHLVHPLGDLAVHQRVAPVGVTIARYGTAPIEGDRRFVVSHVRLNETPVADAARVTIRDSFAPAQLFDLTDQEKLARPSFEALPAGFSFGIDAITFCIEGSSPSAKDIAVRAYFRYVDRGRAHGHDIEDWLKAEEELENSGCVVTRPMVFDTIVMDDRATRRSPASYAISGDVHNAQATASPAASAPLRTTGTDRYRVRPRSMRVKDPTFAVAPTEDLTIMREAATYTEALEELGTIVRDNLQARGKLQVVGKHERGPL